MAILATSAPEAIPVPAEITATSATVQTRLASPIFAKGSVCLPLIGVFARIAQTTNEAVSWGSGTDLDLS